MENRVPFIDKSTFFLKRNSFQLLVYFIIHSLRIEAARELKDEKWPFQEIIMCRCNIIILSVLHISFLCLPTHRELLCYKPPTFKLPQL